MVAVVVVVVATATSTTTTTTTATIRAQESSCGVAYAPKTLGADFTPGLVFIDSLLVLICIIICIMISIFS